MLSYVLRRLAYGFVILIGVNLITFVLFFTVNTPDDMARLNLGGKRVTQDQIDKWKAERGYDKPMLYNAEAQGSARLTETVFWERSVSLFVFDFGRADNAAGGDIGHEIRQRMGVSLSLTVPIFILGLLASVILSLWLVMFRGLPVDFWGVVVCVVMMSISALFYIIVGQFLFAKQAMLAPVSGYASGLDAARFLVLPIGLMVVASLAGQARFYRTLFLEEVSKDYVRTARAKGLGETVVLGRHVLRNAALPIITSAGSALPGLFMGGLLTESFFGIPGLGAYTIDAIGSQDFAIVRAMVFLGSVLYILTNILIDVVYTWADPRVRMQ
ncbi:ABC transporter permease subunit [Aquabacterium fontiphilum]|jgi:peptide/nickel transport system permease protein|uniref:ABC transporter permease n=1 Tax=Aquabacterium fontiphilum TaxID=450365 RepID=UPI001376F337|nr:ABC transporter permease [Aquabacterium fontiphilum]NBD19902.1 ABC transporter permease subunit [Aquabacterium fontiphilum]